jgi:hypothetical protein
MGIRFFCPNGHKLNVKTFLAGKRGICPHCQTKFDIPLESDPKLVGADSSLSAESPVPDLSNTPVIPGISAKTERSSAHGTSAQQVAESTDEAPHAVWYVRPPSGGQFGPASADVMRTWLSEGRVPKDALVWREGWPEWRVADPLFPGLSDGAPPADAVPPGELPSILTDDAPERYISGRIQHRRSNKSNNLIVGLLIFACVALFFVLLFVLRR